MAKVLISESNLTAIANSIRSKLGTQTTYRPSDMPTAIGSISGGATIYYTSDGRAYPENMVIPSTVTSLPQNAYKDFIYLKSVDMSNLTIGVSSSCFMNDINLESVVLPSGVSYVIAQDCFFSCGKLNGIIIPSCVTTIGTRAFKNCTSLTGIVVPEGVSSITTNSFQNCVDLTAVSLPLSLTSIGSNAFSGCISLKNITLADGFLASVNFSYSTEFTADDIMAMFNKLGQVPSGEDRVMNLGATNLSKLTNAQKLVATSRGWTLT